MDLHSYLPGCRYSRLLHRTDYWHFFYTFYTFLFSLLPAFFYSFTHIIIIRPPITRTMHFLISFWLGFCG